MRRFTVSLIIAAAALVWASIAVHAQGDFTKVKGDVYRFRNNAHYALVVVTGSGVVVVDPINSYAANRLKRGLNRITDQPVTHLIYSHSHFDHASGGSELGAQTIIAQANAPQQIDGVTPTMRFNDTKTIKVGSKSLEMTWLGEGHGKDLIVVIVRPENVAFIVDVAAPKHLPYRDIPGGNIDALIKQIKRIDSLDFEIFAPGHGPVGVKADAAHYRGYLEKMRTRVLAEPAIGQIR